VGSIRIAELCPPRCLLFTVFFAAIAVRLKATRAVKTIILRISFYVFNITDGAKVRISQQKAKHFLGFFKRESPREKLKDIIKDNYYVRRKKITK
jgi:hypothetical protein